jgi:predicted nucleic acid-binding protein
VVVAALSAWHERHEDAAAALASIKALPAHVMVEAYSVLTRLPRGLAVPAGTAAEVLEARFGEPPLRLGARERRRLLTTLSSAGVYGGAGYDGLVALEAQAHGRTLLSLDERAQDTYRRLGVPFRAV